MTLEKLFCMIPDGQTVKVCDNASCGELARYDGRESIPEELNDRKIACIMAGAGFNLLIYVY